jgi:release factor glutamine methyltransferase
MARVPTARVIGVDIDRTVAACARRNGVATAVADVGDPLRTERSDLVTAVPPYVPTAELRLLASDVQRYEPRLAHDGGPDGLSVVGRVIAAAGRLLRPSGWLVVEVGGDQLARLGPILASTGFDLVTAWWDADDDLRGIACQR